MHTQEVGKYSRSFLLFSASILVQSIKVLSLCRGVHVVRQRQHHHRGAGRPAPRGGRLRDGHRQEHQPRHLHVQHVSVTSHISYISSALLSRPSHPTCERYIFQP